MTTRESYVLWHFPSRHDLCPRAQSPDSTHEPSGNLLPEARAHSETNSPARRLDHELPIGGPSYLPVAMPAKIIATAIAPNMIHLFRLRNGTLSIEHVELLLGRLSPYRACQRLGNEIWPSFG